ncbi:MAG: nucleotidyl transferase [Parcubacteria group bacterium Gr01-1014_70]|nr:MAG: nucleotidyl transferase [Parcubacteria group bacterium Gr01-1014_70]
MFNSLQHTPIIVLCGGQGIRLRSMISDRPKVLAPLGEQTLLDNIIAMLHAAGFEKIILSVGYLKKQIKSHCWARGYQVVFSEEDEPLGTGGALKSAMKHIDTDVFFVMNGDMIFKPDFSRLLSLQRERNGVMSLFVTRGYQGDGGTVIKTDSANRIVHWRERKPEDKPEKLYLSAGTYFMKKGIARFFPNSKSFSLEKEVFPALFSEPCYGYRTDELLIDIGVPERYALAQKLFS